MFASKSQQNANYHIILLRHGQSIGNLEGRYQGQSDYQLSDTGQAQAKALAKRWSREGTRFDRVISSPLARAWQTAQIIATHLDIPLKADPIWMERNNGLLAGLLPEEAAERHPRPNFMHPFIPIGETGESQWELFLRAGRAVQELLRQPPGNYLVVSHGGILNMVMYVTLGIVPQANFQGARFRFRNAAFASLTYSPTDHIWWLVGLNDREHWSMEE